MENDLACDDEYLADYYDADFTDGYRNPCVGSCYYMGRYHELFQFQYTPKGEDYPPEYVICNDHRHYIYDGYKD